VLRAKNSGQRHILRSGESIDDVLKAAVHRRVIADDADPFAAQAAGRDEHI
jgi:hypothetical protein